MERRRIFPSWWDDKSSLIGMFDFGFDEGGGRNTLLVAAQVGSTNSLRKMCRQWKSVLADAELPFFHSKDYKRRDSGVFKHLSWTKRRKVLLSLASLLHKYACAGLVARIDLTAYNQMTDQRFRSAWATAFSFGIQMSVLAGYVYMMRTSRKHEGINLLIAEGHRNLDQVKAQLPNAANQNNIVRIVSYGFGKMVDHPLLQAADMLAYAEWQRMTNGDLEIPFALQDRSGRYQTEAFDCGKDLIEIGVKGMAAEIQRQREFGRRRPNEAIAVL